MRPRRGELHGCVVTAQIPLSYNGLDAVFQRMRKRQKIATPLSRLAMTIKWDSSGTDWIYPMSGLHFTSV
jgi:hypothetical protein